MLRHNNFSRVDATSWQLLAPPVMTTSIQTTCYHISMHGCGTEGANNHFGKVLLTYATNMAKTSLTRQKDMKKMSEVLEKLSKTT